MSGIAAGGSEPTAAQPALRSHGREMAVGLAAGVVAVAVAALAPNQDDARLYLGALLAGIGFIYVGFAVADGRKSAIVIQAISALVFLQLAQIGVREESNLVLGLGFLAHAAWDAIHHDDHGPTHVRTYYPPFCAVTDVVIGVAILTGAAL